MCRLTPAHIHHFHIIMGMLRKMNEPGMGPDRDLLPFFQQFVSGNDVPAPIHIQRPVNLPAAGQELFFLFCDQGSLE